jgi:tetratricopeptide (TPR) repeat protein
MAGNPNELSQFWHELKRRRVVHVITVYATSAFVIIELVNNLTEPLSLPVSLSTIVVIVLAVGFPLAIILSWIYDLTSKGVEKTKPINEIREGEKPVIPNAWRIATYVSFVVIIGLVTINIVGGTRGLRPGEIQSVLILPYQNYTGDDQLDAIISGMHSALINDLGRIITVMSKTTSDVYKDSDKTLSQIAAELGVDAIIEPGVMCAGDTVCFQLAMNTPDEEQLWFAEYSESKSQLPNIHNRITKQIADELKIELTADQASLLAERRTIDPEAVDAYMKGLFYLDMINMNSLQKAKEYFNIAIEIEPDWAPPYAGLAGVWGYQKQMSLIPPSLAIPKINENLNRALELDPSSSNAHYTKAVIAVWTEWNWEKGEKEFIKSLELNPSNALCRIFYGHLLGILHRSDEAIYQANLAFKLDPQRPFILGLYGALMTQIGKPQSAIPYLKKALLIDSTHRFVITSISAAYRQIGDYDNWFEYFKKIIWYDDKVVASLDSVLQEQGYRAAVEMTIKIEEEVANERYIDIFLVGYRYLQIDNYEKAMDCYEKGYEIHHPNMPYISVNQYGYEQLKENPRYIELLKKMNLPLPGD